MNEAKRANIRLKRIYDPPVPEDGVRILVDRLWPRGISKERAAIGEWMKEIAPSPELREWFCHKPELFAQFREQYEEELKEDPIRSGLVDRICKMAEESSVTLVYAAKDPVHNHAVVLQHWLNSSSP
ncbi:uroporphyrin-III C-methyltransferase [Gordoniibacillus kamchatkensis]|uniref:Uroporphyrin-III C-methyltransferase n=1 Tax=Gordoniibacillus kamchatkensis TaxID=1590651 RepID=A0ABR5AH10_9BACL|nr:DUF488 domain-containing protein [Paenibacillus sp. VKM B-2647]KIL40118.1 uroporphyrin-III C-methyltransferase [Paenibacillus sp. VKM B-2647]